MIDMMTGYVLVALLAVAATGIIAYSGLCAWQQWIEYKRAELDHGRLANQPARSGGSRIEVAELRDRIRKLEAIAAGIDL